MTGFFINRKSNGQLPQEFRETIFCRYPLMEMEEESECLNYEKEFINFSKILSSNEKQFDQWADRAVKAAVGSEDGRPDARFEKAIISLHQAAAAAEQVKANINKKSNQVVAVNKVTSGRHQHR